LLLLLPDDVRRKGEDGFGQFAQALFACNNNYHLDRVRKNADALLIYVLQIHR